MATANSEDATSCGRDAVVVFARAPRPGQVKTRLAACVGNEPAALFYKRCAETVIREMASLARVTMYLFYSRGEDKAEVVEWMSQAAVPVVHLVPQLQDPDLGARIEHAMRHAFSCRHERVAIVGTDVPDLTSSLVAGALQALDSYQAVFGPAADGGFYLLALSTLPSGLFQGIQWSTPSALANNLANARRLGLHVAPLEAMDTLPDIDTLQDLQRWCSSKQHALRQQHKHSYLQQQLQVANGVSLLEVALQVAAGCSTP